MTTTYNDDTNEFGYQKQEKPSMKDFIKPSKQYSEDVKVISDNITEEVDIMAKEIDAFKNAFNEIKDKHHDGMSMESIKDSYVREKEEHEVNDIEDEILDLFSKKLKSLKQNLTT